MFFASKCFEIGKLSKFNFSRCFCVRSPIRSPEEQIRLRATRLAELLDCSLQSATVLIGKNARILSLDDVDVEKIALFCNNNMRFSDVIENPILFTSHLHILNRRLCTLKELGCYDGVHSLVKFDKVMKGIPKTANKTLPYTHKFLSNIFTDCSSDKIVEIKEKILQMYDSNCSFSHIKVELNSYYLVYQLKFTDDKLKKLKKKIPAIFVQSIENIGSSVQMLLKTYGLTLAEIRQCPLILTLSPDYLEKYLELIPTILGVSTKTLIKKNPKILQKSPASLKKLETVLQDFNINEHQLLSCPKVLTIKNTTARYRLQTLLNSKEFVAFKALRNFLWLVLNFKHCHSRLKDIKESGLAYSLGMFMLSKPMFKKRIFLNKSHTYVKDIITYLSDFYNVSEKALRKRISKLPNIYHISYIDVYKVVNFLVNRGVSKEQIWNGLGIITYEPEIVEKFFNELPHYKEFQPFSEWHGHFNLIQLLIYAIERNKNNLISNNKSFDFSAQESARSDENEDESDELFKEFGVDYFSDIEEEDADDSDTDEQKISDVHKL